MSEEEYRTQVSDLKDEITRIEEDTTKKEAGAEKKIEGDWDAKINDTKEKYDVAVVELKEAKEEASKWVKKRDKLIVEEKSLKTQYDKYLKGKEKALKDLLNDIDQEKKSKIKEKDKQIKILDKKLKKLELEKLKTQQ
ncbi:MAG: hypothetical protein KGD73_09985 [Candidatus Lokiarchaeota archaeon]|nr:hypothetical protein [Candidatus Lokiarchaeota archaeon]